MAWAHTSRRSKKTGRGGWPPYPWDCLLYTSFLPVSVKKGGGLKSTSSVTSREGLEKLTRGVDRQLRRLCALLTRGDIEAQPLVTGPGASVCNFCPYKDACHYDETCLLYTSCIAGRRRSDAAVSGVTPQSYCPRPAGRGQVPRRPWAPVGIGRRRKECTGGAPRGIECRKVKYTLNAPRYNGCPRTEWLLPASGPAWAICHRRHSGEEEI